MYDVRVCVDVGISLPFLFEWLAISIRYLTFMAGIDEP